MNSVLIQNCLHCTIQPRMWAQTNIPLSRNGDRRGFTIVELLIVIVLIGILATITVVAYNGIQERAKDAKYHQGAKDLGVALKLHQIEHDSKKPMIEFVTPQGGTAWKIDESVIPESALNNVSPESQSWSAHVTDNPNDACIGVGDYYVSLLNPTPRRMPWKITVVNGQSSCS